MKKHQIARAWRDAEYYASLSDAERAQLPESPVGLIEVDDEVLASITGGCGPKGCPGPNDTTYGSTALCTGCPPCLCAA